MGRPAKHTADDLLDAAVEVFAAEGVRAVTLAAVADRAGATNGSVYYRFPDRATLLSAMWSRTEARFHDAYRERLGERPTIADAIETSAWVVEWCRENLTQAQVLQAGSGVFDAEDTSVGDGAAGEIRRIVAVMQDSTRASRDEVAFAMFELPLAVVRRHLQAGRAPGVREAGLVRGLAAAILDRTGE